MHTKQSLSGDAAAFNETADCTVRAMAATTGLPYAECHAFMKAQGRRPRKGLYPRQWEKAYAEAGFELVDVTRQIPGRTIRTATRYLPRRRKFILQVRGHVAGFDGQNLLDWADGRQHRIQRVLEVVPTEKVEPIVVKDYNDAPKPRRADLNKFFIKTIVAKNDLGFRAAPQLYKIVTPPARVHREKWARENHLEICAHGHTGVIELKGDAAVNYRKANNVRGRVFMIFGFKRGE